MFEGGIALTKSEVESLSVFIGTYIQEEVKENIDDPDMLDYLGNLFTIRRRCEEALKDGNG